MSSTELFSFLGLSPSRLLLVGAGYSREEIKDHLLSFGQGLVADAVMGPVDLALKLWNLERASSGLPLVLRTQLIGAPARREILSRLLSEKAFRSHFPRLRRMKHQVGFFTRLDRALQAGRMGFGSDDEYEVMIARAVELGADPAMKQEIAAFSRGYEAYCQSKDVYDEPMVLAFGTQALSVLSPEKVHARFPSELLYLGVGRPPSRLEAFFDAVKNVWDWQEWQAETATALNRVGWERWHTFDDAAEGIAEVFDATQDAILIADQPELRRSLFRAFRDRGIELEDPRDPTVLRSDEALKRALLPLQLVSENFPRERVAEYCLSPQSSRTEAEMHERARWVDRMEAFGIRDGLLAYERAGLNELVRELREIDSVFRGKKDPAHLARVHLDWLAREGNIWLGFIEKIWRELEEDHRRIDRGARKAPLLYWLLRFDERLREAKPPALARKNRGGAKVFRLSQGPMPLGELRFQRIFAYGLSSRWLEEEGMGDLWFSERERLKLGAEFALPSAAWRKEERLAVIRDWATRAEELLVCDAAYGFDGKEREGLGASLSLLSLSVELPQEATERAGHDRWLPSFGPTNRVPSQELRVAALPEGAPIAATAVDASSRCEYVGLAQSRWKLRDLREADLEMWGSSFGDLLHWAVKRRVEGLSLEQAMDEAWREKPPKGMIRSARLERVARAKLERILRKFDEKEAEFRERAGTQTLSLEGPRFEYATGGLVLRGSPDRVEQSEQGLLVIDYKTNAQTFGAKEMIEQSYGLQLPIYALVLREKLGREVAGAQFVELTREGSRGRGLLFKAWNGKKPGMLTNSLARNSLREEAPEELWPRLALQVEAQAKRVKDGQVRVRPRREPHKECPSCRFRDSCGRRRLEASGLATEGSES